MIASFVFLVLLLFVVVFLQRDVLARLGFGRMVLFGMMWAVIILALIVIVRLLGLA